MLRLVFAFLLVFYSSRNQHITCSPTAEDKAVQNATTAGPTDEASEVLNEDAAARFLTIVNAESDRRTNELYHKLWRYNTDIKAETRTELLEYQQQHGVFTKERWLAFQAFKDKWPTYTNESIKRQFKLYSVIGTAALPKGKYAAINIISNKMQEIYNLGKICDFHNKTKCDLTLEQDIKKIMSSSRDYDELIHVWTAWRDSTGKPNRKLFEQYILLGNEAAKLNGFKSADEMLVHGYESETFKDDVAALHKDLSPLYKQLHAYVRRKLREIYGEDKVPKRGPIPAHILGNMWAQTWDTLYDILIPFPKKTSTDFTQALVDQGYTPKKIFEAADDFFASLQLERVPASFWNLSLIEKPTDGREVVCHATAWDFSDGKDFRIKTCTQMNMEHFYTVHHEMGHIQYYMQYKDLPHIYKRGANPGFHEAIGDVISLSVVTPKHLHKLGLLENYTRDEESDINFLMQSSLQKIVFLPFGYLIDLWRWETYNGSVAPHNYTCTWWNYRYNFQGVTPPVTRNEEDFDPASKFHVAAHYSYISYFVSYIIQFQIHKASCLAAGEYDPNDPQKPLHQCDIFQSAEAGKALGDMMKLGSKEPWQVVLKQMTGSEKMDTSAIREYFLPLEKWLIADNEKHGEFIGWEGEKDFCLNSGETPKA